MQSNNNKKKTILCKIFVKLIYSKPHFHKTNTSLTDFIQRNFYEKMSVPALSLDGFTD